MTNEPRLVDDADLGEFGRELLQAGRQLRPTRGARERLLLTLGATPQPLTGDAQGAGQTLTTGAALQKSGLTAIAKWAVGAGAIAVAGALVVVGVTDRTTESSGDVASAVVENGLTESAPGEAKSSPAEASRLPVAQVGTLGAHEPEKLLEARGAVQEANSSRAAAENASAGGALVSGRPAERRQQMVVGIGSRGAESSRTVSTADASLQRTARAPRAVVVPEPAEATPKSVVRAQDASASSIATGAVLVQHGDTRLAEEVHQLDAVRGALLRENLELAAELLQRYRREFPVGALVPEALRLEQELGERRSRSVTP